MVLEKHVISIMKYIGFFLPLVIFLAISDPSPDTSDAFEGKTIFRPSRAVYFALVGRWDDGQACYHGFPS